MDATDWLIVCRCPDREDPELPDGFGVVAGTTTSFRRPVPIHTVSLAEILRDLEEERASYVTATVGEGNDKMVITPRHRVLRIVGADGCEWLATTPDDTSFDNLRSLPTRAQLDKWLLRYAPTL